jgi:hypothetical protein
MSSASQWGGVMPMNMGMAMPMNMSMPPMQGQLPRGMVWGMPMRNVAVAPGIVSGQGAAAPVAGASSSANKQLGPGPTLATPVAPAVQQQQQQACVMGPLLTPMWPGMGMWGAMWPGVCYPGMPQLGGMTPAQQGTTAGAAAVPAAAAAAGGGMHGMPCQYPGVMPVPVQQGMSGVIPGLPQFSAPAQWPSGSTVAPVAAPGGMLGWGAPTPAAAPAVQTQQ